MKDKILDFIFGLSSLIGLILTAVLFMFALIKGDYSVEANTYIFGLSAITLALAVVCIFLFKRAHLLSQDNALLQPAMGVLRKKVAHLKSDYRNKDEDIAEVSDILHSIHDQLRDRNFELYDINIRLLGGESISESKLVDYGRTTEMFYLFMLNNIKTIFDLLTEDKCSVCIKILDQNDSGNDIMLRTLMRDSRSYRERKSSDKSILEYPYYENTAFKSILEPDTPDSYYASDDLSSERTYINMNSGWDKSYNATLVCPIRLELVEEEETVANEYSVLGFICVDNMKGGLNNKTTIQLLASISDSLYNHFLLFSDLQNYSIKPD